MKVDLTQWNKFGDHPLVKENTCKEYEYTEAAVEGAGMIDTYIIVWPTYYIVEINGVFVGVIPQARAEKILANKNK